MASVFLSILRGETQTPPSELIINDPAIASVGKLAEPASLRSILCDSDKKEALPSLPVALQQSKSMADDKPSQSTIVKLEGDYIDWNALGDWRVDKKIESASLVAEIIAVIKSESSALPGNRLIANGNVIAYALHERRVRLIRQSDGTTCLYEHPQGDVHHMIFKKDGMVFLSGKSLQICRLTEEFSVDVTTTLSPPGADVNFMTIAYRSPFLAISMSDTRLMLCRDNESDGNLSATQLIKLDTLPSALSFSDDGSFLLISQNNALLFFNLLTQTLLSEHSLSFTPSFHFYTVPYSIIADAQCLTFSSIQPYSSRMIQSIEFIKSTSLLFGCHYAVDLPFIFISRNDKINKKASLVVLQIMDSAEKAAVHSNVAFSSLSADHPLNDIVDRISPSCSEPFLCFHSEYALNQPVLSFDVLRMEDRYEVYCMHLKSIIKYQLPIDIQHPAAKEGDCSLVFKGEKRDYQPTIFEFEKGIKISQAEKLRLKLEKERQDQIEQERIKEAKLEKERQERIEQEKIREAKLEKERQERIEQERIKEAKLAKERQEKIELERIELEKINEAKLEKEREEQKAQEKPKESKPEKKLEKSKSAEMVQQKKKEKVKISAEKKEQTPKETRRLSFEPESELSADDKRRESLSSKEESQGSTEGLHVSTAVMDGKNQKKVEREKKKTSTVVADTKDKPKKEKTTKNVTEDVSPTTMTKQEDPKKVIQILKRDKEEKTRDAEELALLADKIGELELEETCGSAFIKLNSAAHSGMTTASPVISFVAQQLNDLKCGIVAELEKLRSDFQTIQMDIARIKSTSPLSHNHKVTKMESDKKKGETTDKISVDKVLAKELFNEALVNAVSHDDQSVLLALLKAFDPNVLLEDLSPSVLLTLIQQLSFDMEEHTLLKVRWLNEALLKIRMEDGSLEMLGKATMSQVKKTVTAKIAKVDRKDPLLQELHTISIRLDSHISYLKQGKHNKV